MVQFVRQLQNECIASFVVLCEKMELYIDANLPTWYT